MYKLQQVLFFAACYFCSDCSDPRGKENSARSLQPPKISTRDISVLSRWRMYYDPGRIAVGSFNIPLRPGSFSVVQFFFGIGNGQGRNYMMIYISPQSKERSLQARIHHILIQNSFTTHSIVFIPPPIYRTVLNRYGHSHHSRHP